MKYLKVEKSYFVMKMTYKPRLEVMEYLEKNYFPLDKISFIWNTSDKNEYTFYGLLFDSFFSKSQKCEIEKIKFNNLLTYFNV